MSTVIPEHKARTATPQGDLLLWAGGAVVAVLAITWLVLAQLWSSGGDLPAGPPQPESGALRADNPAERRPELGTAFDSPLRMAELAFEAGMLTEPEEYSAWALYRLALEKEPGSAAAREGLRRVADELVRRGEAALEQGRFADAQSNAERILAALPGHAGAAALAANSTQLAPRAVAVPGRELTLPSLAGPQVAARRPTAVPPLDQPQAEPAPAAAPPSRLPRATGRAARAELLETAFAAFEAALAANRLLTPLDDSAKHYAAELAALSADHERTRYAREALEQAFLDRAAEALAALDTTAASTWIDEAERLGLDGARVAAARSAVGERLAAMEAARPLPASELSIVHYVAPEYPARALARGIEGWVDIEFVVGTDGATRDVAISGASHESLFRREATTAVEQWRFQPRQFMGRPITQRSYTRIRFVQ